MSQPPWLLAMNGNYMRLNAAPGLQMLIQKCHDQPADLNDGYLMQVLMAEVGKTAFVFGNI